MTIPVAVQGGLLKSLRAPPGPGHAGSALMASLLPLLLAACRAHTPVATVPRQDVSLLSAVVAELGRMEEQAGAEAFLSYTVTAEERAWMAASGGELTYVDRERARFVEATLERPGAVREWDLALLEAPVPLPLDDAAPTLALGLREASRRAAAAPSPLGPEAAAGAVVSIAPRRRLALDEAEWGARLRRYSSAAAPTGGASEARLEAAVTTRTTATSKGSRLQSSAPRARLSLWASAVTADGRHVERVRELVAETPAELPVDGEILEAAAELRRAVSGAAVAPSPAGAPVEQLRAMAAGTERSWVTIVDRAAIEVEGVLGVVVRTTTSHERPLSATVVSGGRWGSGQGSAGLDSEVRSRGSLRPPLVWAMRMALLRASADGPARPLRVVPPMQIELPDSGRPPTLAEATRLVEGGSRVFAEYPTLRGLVRLRAEHGSRTTFATDGAFVRAPERWTETEVLAARDVEGVPLTRRAVLWTLGALPREEEVRDLARRLAEELAAMSTVVVLSGYEGPLLLEAEAAAAVLAARLPGLLVVDERDGSSNLSRQVLPISFSVDDDPLPETTPGLSLPARVLADDEGVVTGRVRVVDSGVVVEPLLTLAAPPPSHPLSRGNARARRTSGLAVATPTTLLVSARSGLSAGDLRRAFLEQVRAAGLSRGLLVRAYDVDDGPLYERALSAALVDLDGRETAVVAPRLDGLDLLSIAAWGDTGAAWTVRQMHHRGEGPSSVVAPALLFPSVTLKAPAPSPPAPPAPSRAEHRHPPTRLPCGLGGVNEGGE